jgi:hypothetical protein
MQDREELAAHVARFVVYHCPYKPCTFHTGFWSETLAQQDYERHKKSCQHRKIISAAVSESPSSE